MLAARGGRSEKEKDRKDRNHYKSTGLCSQRRGWGRMEWGRGPFPGGARRWEVARTKRNTTPKWAPDAPKPPSPPPHPTHERDTAPLPTQITRGDTVSPPHGQTYPPWNPHGRDGPPSQGSLTRRCPPKRLSHGQHKPSQHQRQPPPREEMAPGGASLGREWYPRAPRRKDNSEMLSLIPNAAGQTPPIREMGEGQRHLFRGASETAFSLEREPAKTDLS